MNTRTPQQEVLNSTAWQPRRWIGLTGQVMDVSRSKFPQLQEVVARTTSAILRVMYHVKP